MLIDRISAFLMVAVVAISGAARAAAPNDAFDRPIDLGAVVAWSAVVDTVAATAQVGEPAHPGFFSTHGSLWWTWTAPDEPGELEFILAGGMTMQLYRGDQLNELVRVDANDAMPANRRPLVTGETYRLMVGGNGTATRAGFVFHPRPPNDDFANAADLGNAFPRIVTARNDAATREPGEPVHWTSGEGGSLWWTWTAPVDGVVDIDFPDAPVSGWVLAAYRGADLANLTLIERAYSQQATVKQFRVSAGEIIRLALANGSRVKREGIRFRIEMRELYNNDKPENALDLGKTGSASFTGDTTAASPDPQGSPYRGAIWWRWSPPVNGRVILRFSAGNSTGNLGLFRLLADGTRQPVATTYHPIREYCRADETYLIRLEQSAPTPVTIGLTLDPAPPNDDLAGALPLPFTSTPYDLSFAGAEPGEAPGNSIWWHFIPPVDGALIAEGSASVGSVAPPATPADLTPVPDASHAPGRRRVTGGQPHFLATRHVPYTSTTLVDSLEAEFVPLTSGNNAFADAAPLGSAASGRVFATMAGATTEPGEPDASGGSLWWSWTAPFNGMIVIELKPWGYESSYFRHLVDLQQIVRLFLVSWALVRVWFPRVMQGEAPLTVTLRGIRVERDRFSVAD